jgi:O-antigen/teichoic acid export membrane protein
VARGAGLTGILWGHVVASGLLIVGGLALVRVYVGPVRGGRPTQELGPIVRAALPFFLIDALEVVHFKLDTVMLGFFRPYAEVALYEGSARLLEASQFVMRPLMAVFLPVCTAMAVAERWPELSALAGRLLRWAAVLGALVAAIVLLLATPALTLVYGRGFEAAAPLLRVLSLATPLVYLSFVALFVGNALRLERRAVVLLLGSVALNVALNLLLIPRLGGLGAAITTVVTYALLAALLVRLNLQLLREGRSAAQARAQGG